MYITKIINKWKGKECFKHDIGFDSKVEAIEKSCTTERVKNLVNYLEREHSQLTEFINELQDFQDGLEEHPKQKVHTVKTVEPTITRIPISKNADQESDSDKVKILPAGTELEFHDLANWFPMQTDEEFSGLCSDIKNSKSDNKIQDPIKLYKGKIIDGRNRYNACRALNIPIPVEEVDLTEEELGNYVFSSNISRRHLNSGQKAVIALIELNKVEANSRSRQLGKDPSGKNSLRGKSSDILAKKYGTNAKYVEWAKELKAKNQKLLEDVFNGNKKLSNVYTAFKSQGRTTPREIPRISIPVFVFEKLIQGDCQPEELLPHMSKDAQAIAQKALEKGA